MCNYKTFKADPEDFIYTTNYYNQEHSSITLLISKKEIDEEFTEKEKLLSKSVV